MNSNYPRHQFPGSENFQPTLSHENVTEAASHVNIPSAHVNSQQV